MSILIHILQCRVGIKIKVKKILQIFLGIITILFLMRTSHVFLNYSTRGVQEIDSSELSFAASKGGTALDNIMFILGVEDPAGIKWVESEEFKQNNSTFMEDKDNLYIRIKLKKSKGEWTNPAIYFQGLKGWSFEAFLNGRPVYESEDNFIGRDLDLDKIYKSVILPLSIPDRREQDDELQIKNSFGKDVLIVKDEFGVKDELKMKNSFDEDVLVVKLYKGSNKAVHPYLDQGSILIGEHRNIITSVIKNSMKKLILNSVIATIAVMFAMIGILFKGRDKKILFSMSLFSFCMGIYGVASVRDINAILMDSPIIWSYLYYLALAYSPYAFAYFFEHVFGEGFTKIIRFIRCLQSVSAAVLMGTVVLHTASSGIFDIIQIGRYFLYFSLFVLIAATLTASIAGVCKRSSEAAIFTAGICIYTYYIIYSVLNNEDINELGLILFILSLIIITARRFLRMGQEVIANSKELEVKNMELTTAWNEISVSKEEIHELNKTLEQRVHDRTKALEVTNWDLKVAMERLQLTQNQLIQSEKLVALGGLVAGVSHEINTPVGVSVTAASHLKEKTEEISAAFSNSLMKKSDLEKYLNLANESTEVILSNSRRASELIKSFKQVAVDQSDEQKRSFKVKEYIEQVLLSLKPKLKKTNISIGINCDEGLQINSYAGALSQIVTNLVMNSLIHAFEEGQEGTIIFDIEKQGNNILFTYSDNGKGISKDIIGKIFDPFFTTKRGQGGTGLGLNIVYNIVTQTFGGTIECKSKTGLGTAFNISFPAELN
jgi:signal transduction histidine kinase